ncbi:MAG: NAD(P)H-hydrate epimerase, partial [Candidatus Binataceae bacterium]
MKLLNAEESRQLDRLSQDKFGVPSYSLMSRAGEAVARIAAKRWREALAAGALIVAGKGNNGGDGMVAARHLKDSGARVRAVLLARVADL